MVPCGVRQPEPLPSPAPCPGVSSLGEQESPRSRRLRGHWPLPTLPAGPTPIPSRPSCLSPAWRPHRRASLSAGSHRCGNRALCPPPQDSWWPLPGRRLLGPGHLAQESALGPVTAGTGEGSGHLRPEASRGWGPSPQRARGSSEPQASPRGGAQGSAWSLPPTSASYPRSCSAPPGMGREPPRFTPFGTATSLGPFCVMGEAGGCRRVTTAHPSRLRTLCPLHHVRRWDRGIRVTTAGAGGGGGVMSQVLLPDLRG